MFCCKACEKIGVCGKTDEISAVQDLIVYALRGLGLVAREARAVGIVDVNADRFAAKALFSTLTNVNFDAAPLVEHVKTAIAFRDALAAKVAQKGGKVPAAAPMNLKAPLGVNEAIEAGRQFGINETADANPDIKSLQHTLLFGIKGVAAYADHAAILGQEDPAVYAFLHEALAAPYTTPADLGAWVNLCMECGRVNLRAMELLDAGNTGTYGHPVPTTVPLGHKKGKAILVSGHDLKDLHTLLKQTEGKGITVYTHGEMLPTHGYPELKKFSHFFGHYGTAWQNQQKEFAAFPGSILMTTNCIQKPTTYLDTIYTTGLVGWPGATHVGNEDFSAVIEKALAMPGFAEDQEAGSVMVGFARNTVMSVAGTVIDAVKAGKIKHFFLVAGCDGAKPGRNYYTEFVEQAPEDTIILTLACGKFRFFDKKLGDIGGIPRLLDVGQCNDAYSAVQIAVALAGAFNCGVNDLPLSMILSWYEQKAVAILLTLLSLGIKNIKLGPTLPAFLTPNVLNYLVQNFNIGPITTPADDIKASLNRAA